jgi:flagellar basal body-associated protein FliL
MAKESNSSDEIPLDELIRSEGKADQGALPSESPGEAAVPAPSSLDEALAVEDPDFAKSIGEITIQQVEAAAEVEIDPLDLAEALKMELPTKSLKGRFQKSITKARARLDHFLSGMSVERLKTGGREFSANAAESSKAAAVASLAFVKTRFSDIRAIPRSTKLLFLATLTVGTASIFVFKAVLSGPLLPSLRTEYLSSFAEVSNKSYAYDSQEPLDDFADPLYQPEYMVELKRLVVNLRSPDGRSNPMGLFEFYLESNTQDGAIELRDREVEVRDVISRTIESMPYEELSTTVGKSKLKSAMQRNLNQLLTKGRVRRVYYKTLVIKP